MLELESEESAAQRRNQRGQGLTLKKTDAEFSFIEIWLTYQNNRPLEIEDNLNITLIIGTS